MFNKLDGSTDTTDLDAAVITGTAQGTLLGQLDTVIARVEWPRPSPDNP